MTIPNYDSASYKDQSRPSSVDFDTLTSAIKGDGVISGCAVSAKNPVTSAVAVAAGSVVINNTVVSVTSGDVSITSAHASLPRHDLIVVASNGTKSAVAGTASSTPLPPDLSANQIALATVYVPANTNTIATNQITDKRVIVEDIYRADFITTATSPYLANERVLGLGNNLTSLANGSNLFIKTDNIGGQTVPTDDFVEFKSGTSATYTIPAGKTIIKELFMVGGGGGGGGGNGSFSTNPTTPTAGLANGASGGGGGCIVYARNIPVTAGSTITYTIGNGGNGGVNGGNGVVGSNTTLTVGADTFTAAGGGGGISNGAVASAVVAGTTPPTTGADTSLVFSDTGKTTGSVQSATGNGVNGAPGTNSTILSFSNAAANAGNGGTVVSQSWGYSSVLSPATNLDNGGRVNSGGAPVSAKTRLRYINNEFVLGQIYSSSNASINNASLKSTDGTSWSLTSGLPETIYDIAYSDSQSRWVAVGSYRPNDANNPNSTTTSAISTSSDGITWTQRSLPSIGGLANITLTSVAWSANDGIWVAVGYQNATTTGGVILSSSDGITWTSRQTVNTNYFTSVARSEADDLWVAVGVGGIIYTSADGTTWTSRTSGTTVQFNAVARSEADDLWVAVGSSTGANATPLMRTSSDGITWSTVTLSTTGGLSSIAYSESADLWIATGQTEGLTPSGTIWSSSDGSTWTNRYSGSNVASTISSVAYSSSEGQWIAVGNQGTFYTSTDGTSWTTSAIDVGFNSDASSSSTKRYPNTIRRLESIDKWILCRTTAMEIALSSDASNWDIVSAHIKDADYSSTDKYVIATRGGLFTANSLSDKRTRRYSTNIINHILYSPSQSLWMAVGNSGTILTSSNGVSWSTQTSGTTNNLNYIARSESQNLWMVVGAGGTILTSSDNGGTWSSQTSGTATQLYCVARSDDQDIWYAGSASSTQTLLKSTGNGASWSATALGAYRWMTNIAYSSSPSLWMATNEYRLGDASTTGQPPNIYYSFDGSSWSTTYGYSTGGTSGNNINYVYYYTGLAVGNQTWVMSGAYDRSAAISSTDDSDVHFVVSNMNTTSTSTGGTGGAAGYGGSGGNGTKLTTSSVPSQGGNGGSGGGGGGGAVKNIGSGVYGAVGGNGGNGGANTGGGGGGGAVTADYSKGGRGGNGGSGYIAMILA